MDSKARFTDRVDNYAKYRPSYPPEAVDCIARLARMEAGSPVADIGAGTGKFTQLLLARGWRVWAVEPNDAMRAAAERDLASNPNFRSVAAAAEATGLSDHAVDLITSAQAFHWFDPAACKVEFRRILRPGGKAALVWNSRSVSSPFMARYKEIADGTGGEHPRVDNEVTPATFERFFDGAFETHRFPFQQILDFEGLLGRTLSSSQAPTPSHPNYAPLKNALRVLFDQYQTDGLVTLAYQTTVTIGGW
jgi:SAM-dependent methyltransferase